MADPLSVSASIAGLVTITDAVFRRAFKYVKAVKGAPNELSALITAIGALSGILHNLSLIACQLEGEPFDSTIQASHINSCLQTVDKIKSILDKFDSSTEGHSMKTMKRLKWPFSGTEVKALCTEIERHKTTLSLALTADGLSGLLQNLSRQKDIQSGINGIESELKRKREVETRIAMTKERRKVLDWIQPYDPHQNHGMSLRLKHPGTGLWFMESDEIKSWLRCPGARLWCYGIPGAGKTVLASSIIQEAIEQSCPNVAVAFFYCDYNNAATQEPRNILGSLACQFALQDEVGFEKLRAFYEKHNPAERPSTEFSLDDLRDLIVNMASSFNNAMIVVDALDECGTQSKFVTRLLSDLHSRDEAGSIKTLFLSRDEEEIREVLDGYEEVSLAARSSDLTLFVGAQIELRIRNRDLRIKDESLKQDIMERLVEGADGMFRWVACQMDHLCQLPNDAARRKALNALPPTLHATYERILQRINRSNKDIQQLVQRSLRWLVCSRDHLTSQALCEAISIETGDTSLDPTRISDEKEILRWCSSLVRRSALGDGLELAHFTVKDFLMTGIDQRDREFGVYHVDLDDDAELAEGCLTYLSFQEYKSEGDIGEMPPTQSWKGLSLHAYAIVHWPEHARHNLSKPVVLSLTQELLHPSKQHIISWAQALRSIVYGRSYRDTKDADPRTASPLHFASMLALPDCCEWLLQKGCYINQPSAFGTPLECALAGHCAMAGEASLRVGTTPIRNDIVKFRLATVKLLMENGANVHRSSLGQPSPLFIALRMADKVSCIGLLRKGAIIDSNAIDELSFSDRYDLAREIWEGIDATSLRPEDRATLLDAALCSERFSKDELITDLAHRSQDLSSVFLTAAEYGQFGVVEQIAQDHTFNINITHFENQNSALHLAASNGHVDIVKFLIEHEANCNPIDSLGRTPLHASVEKPRDCRCLKMLLSQKVELSLGDKDGLTVWHLAALKGNLHALRILWDFSAHGQLLLHSKAIDGRTLLHCAAQSSSKETLIFLMDHCSQSHIHETTSEGFTALHYAVKADSLLAVRYLIDRAFDVNAMTNDGSNVLHCAVDHDSKIVYEIIDLLLKSGVDLCKVRKDGMTPINLLLSTASQTPYDPHVSNELEAILRVITKHATSLNITYGAGLSPLHQVCQLRKDNIADDWRPNALEILLQNGADPRMQDNKGRTALMYLVEACKKNFLKYRSIFASDISVTMIKQFLNSTNDEQFLSDACTHPQILCLALISGNEELAYKALEYCSSVDATVNEISELSCLKTACSTGCSRQLLEELLRRSEGERGIAGSQSGLLICACTVSGPNNKMTVIDLLDLGFDPNERNTDGKSALMMAARNGDIAVVEILIDHGADLYAIDKEGWSVIHDALLSGREELWHFLRRRISDWNATITATVLGSKYRDATAIHLAAHLGSNALDFLLHNDLISDINHVAEPPDTALCIAVRSKISRNVDLLLGAGANSTLSWYGAQPLHIAAECGYLKIVKVFANAGLNLITRDKNGLTPELFALKNGHLDVAEFLKEKTSAGLGSCHALGKKISRLPFEKIRLAIEIKDIELCRALMEEVTNNDDGFLDYECETRVSFAEEDIFSEHTRRIYASKGDMVKGYKLFHYAASTGNVEILQILFGKAPREILRCCQPVHPIHLAITGGHGSCVDLIIDEARRVEREMLLGHVCGTKYGLSHVLEIPVSQSGSHWLLYPTSSRTFSEFVNATPLMIAAALGEVDIARSLIEHGASVDGMVKDPNTPLHFAAFEGKAQVVELLISFGANLNARNALLWTPCMSAALDGCLASVQALANAGADLTLKDVDGEMAVHYAALRTFDADSSACSAILEVIVFLAHKMQDLLFFAESKEGHSIITISGWAYPPYQSFLLNLAPNPSVYEPRQSNIISATVMTNTPIDLKRLLRRLPRPLIPTLLAHEDRILGTPLYSAAIHPSENVIDMLLDAGADLELVGGDHGTPLMGACAAGRLEMVKALVGRGARTSYTEDGNVFSALSMAKLHPKITRWLLVGRFAEGPLLLENGSV